MASPVDGYPCYRPTCTNRVAVRRTFCTSCDASSLNVRECHGCGEMRVALAAGQLCGPCTDTVIGRFTAVDNERREAVIAIAPGGGFFGTVTVSQIAPVVSDLEQRVAMLELDSGPRKQLPVLVEVSDLDLRMFNLEIRPKTQVRELCECGCPIMPGTELVCEAEGGVHLIGNCP